jgi:serine O-acetyltransferase
VTIGARSVIGANAVVVHDAPADSVIVGIPGVVRPTGRSRDEEMWMDPGIYI